MSSSRRSCPVVAEVLERRTLFASFAPSAVAGLVIELSFSSSAGEFPPAGTVQDVKFSADASTYEFPDNGSSGTLGYSRVAANQSSLRFTDTSDNFVTTATLNFASLTTGSFSARSLDGSGSGSGTFRVTGTVRTLASVVDNVLTITGTIADDTVSITSSAGNISVRQNNWTQTFSAASVYGINGSLRDGGDVLSVGTGVIGIYCDCGIGNDYVVGGDGKDTLTGGAGKDTLDGGGGDDRLNGLAHNDSLMGNIGNDRLYGGDGNDMLVGGSGVDRIWGGLGDDYLVGNASYDKLYAEDGNDTLAGGAGIDILDGGLGTDTVIGKETGEFPVSVEVLK